MRQPTPSWVIKNRQADEVLFETFSRELVEKLNTSKYTAVPIYRYLVDLNAEIRAQNAKNPAV